MRSLYIAVGLALCSSSVLAADFGIGVSARSNDGWVYAPIDISKSFRIEPGVRYSSNDTTVAYGTVQTRWPRRGPGGGSPAVPAYRWTQIGRAHV